MPVSFVHLPRYYPAPFGRIFAAVFLFALLKMTQETTQGNLEFSISKFP